MTLFSAAFYLNVFCDELSMCKISVFSAKEINNLGSVLNSRSFKKKQMASFDGNFF